MEEPDVKLEPTKRRVRFWQVAAMTALAYIGSYFALMARNVPAVDDTGQVAFKSSFRKAPGAGRNLAGRLIA